MLVALLLACPQVLTPPLTVLDAGCPAPAVGVLYTFEADADRHSDLLAGRAALRLCRSARDDARSDVDRVAHSMLGRLESCRVDLDDAATELDAAASALDVAEESRKALVAKAARVLPAWAWTLAGAAAPAAAVGVCSAVGCSEGRAWASAATSLGVVAGAALVLEW